MSQYNCKTKRLIKTGEKYHEIIHVTGTESILVYDNGKINIHYMGALRRFDSIEELIHLIRAYERLVKS